MGHSERIGTNVYKNVPGEKDQRIFELEKEVRELTRANEILKDALGFFAARRKK